MRTYREILIYVEGPSDAQGLEILFRQLIDDKQRSGIAIRFIPSQGKKNLLNHSIEKALNIVLNRSAAEVVLLPDLYPRNMGLPHETYDELTKALEIQLLKLIQTKSINDSRVLDRIHLFCFKHDFECLLLAAPEQLKNHLDTSSLHVTWTTPVENQNHNDPPKRVVERIFESCAEKYIATEDAFEILGAVRYQTLAEACPQNFKPFVEYLEGL